MVTPESNSACLSAEDVARRLGVSRMHVYRLVRNGALPPGVTVRVGRRKLQFDRAMLENWIRAGGAGPKSRSTADTQKSRGAGLSALMSLQKATRERSE